MRVPLFISLPLLLLGVLLVRWVHVPPRQPLTWTLLASTVVLVAFPLTRRFLERGAAFLRSLPAGRTALCLAIFASGELLLSALVTHRDLFPRIHDEMSYLVELDLLSRGRVAAAPAAAAESFQSFFILTDPVYTSIYLPGTALLFLPGKLVHLSHWMTAIVLAGASVGVTYLLLRRFVEGDLAFSGAMLLLGGIQFRIHSTQIMSQLPTLLVGTGVLVLAMRWREKSTFLTAAALGAAGGLLVILRPQDAACFLPAAALLTLPASPKNWAKSAFLALAAALPFLLLGALHNYNATRSPFHTAYWTYVSRYQPGVSLLFTSAPPTVTTSTGIAQMDAYRDTFTRQAEALRQTNFFEGVIHLRTALALAGPFPSASWAVFVPLGVIVLLAKSAGRKVAVAGFLGAGVYLSFTFFLPHYVLPFTPLLILVIVMAPTAFKWPWARTAFVALAIVHSVMSWPEVCSEAQNPQVRSHIIAGINRIADGLEHKPALLLIRYNAGDRNIGQAVPLGWSQDLSSGKAPVP